MLSALQPPLPPQRKGGEMDPRLVQNKSRKYLGTVGDRCGALLLWPAAVTCLVSSADVQSKAHPRHCIAPQHCVQLCTARPAPQIPAHPSALLIVPPGRRIAEVGGADGELRRSLWDFVSKYTGAPFLH